MTRPFGLHDLGLLWYLRGQGITLDMQRALLSTEGPLRAALSGLLPPGYLGTTLTYVCRCPETDDHCATEGYAQVMTCPERLEWQVIRLAPWFESPELTAGMGWVGVLGDLCALAGEWGALRVRAGVPAGGAEEEAFRQAGFAVYAREEVYRLAEPGADGDGQSALRPVNAQDSWSLVQLVDQVVPPTVQHAEGMHLSGAPVPVFARLGVIHEQGFVLPQSEVLGAYVGLSRGRGGAWARILLHPDARKQAAEVIHHAVRVSSPGPALYCAVRDYQAGLRSLLVAADFTFVGVQVWLVKHTTRPATCVRYRHVGAHDLRVEPVTTPLHPASDTELTSCSPLTREHWVYEYRRADRYAVSPD